MVENGTRHPGIAVGPSQLELTFLHVAASTGFHVTMLRKCFVTSGWNIPSLSTASLTMHHRSIPKNAGHGFMTTEAAKMHDNPSPLHRSNPGIKLQLFFILRFHTEAIRIDCLYPMFVAERFKLSPCSS